MDSPPTSPTHRPATPEPRRSAADRAYSHVKTRVLSGELQGGQLFSEGDVAGELGVSRTPVREALLRLEGEGLIRLYPKKGALVVPVTAQEARDVLQARSVIEEWASAAMWPQRHEVVEPLTDLLMQMRRARRDDDVGAFAAADRSFHETIVAAAGNAILTRQYRALRERQLCISTAVVRMSPARMDRAVSDHADLLTELDEGTKRDFLALTRSHLRRATEHARGVA